MCRFLLLTGESNLRRQRVFTTPFAKESDQDQIENFKKEKREWERENGNRQVRISLPNIKLLYRFQESQNIF